LLAVVSVGLRGVLLQPVEVIVLRLLVGRGAALQVLLAESLPVVPRAEAEVLMGAQQPEDLKTHLSASSSTLQN